MATAATTFFSQEQACQQLHMHFNPCDTKEAMDATCKTHGLKHSYTKTRVSSSACALYKLGSALECLCFTQTRVLPSSAIYLSPGSPRAPFAGLEVHVDVVGGAVWAQLLQHHDQL